MMVKLKRNDSFQLTKMKKWYPQYHSANWMNSMMKFNFHHVEMNMIQLEMMLLFNSFLSPSQFSLSLIHERYLNWTQLIESDNLFIWRNLYDGKSTIQSLLLGGKRKKVNDGSWKWRWWDQRRKWLTAQIVGRWKGVERRKSTIESLLEILFCCWKYDLCREEKRRLSCEFLFEWIRKNDYSLSKFHQTQKWYSSISHCELN